MIGRPERGGLFLEETMKKALPICALISLILAGCASVPKVSNPSGVDVSLRALSEVQVEQRFGSIDGYDPYITPSTIVNANPDQYIVVELTIAAAKEARISVFSLVAKDADGRKFAHFFQWDDFAAYLDGWKEDAHAGQMLTAKAARDYLRNTDFDMKPGRRSYMAVLIGKKPLPKDFTIEVMYGVDDATSSITIKGKI